MQRYLTPILNADDANTVRRVPIDDPVAVFRRDGEDYTIVAETPETTVALGIGDAAVSGKKNGEAPVKFIPAQNGVRVQNISSQNPIRVSKAIGDRELTQGESEIINSDCIVHLGIATELRVTVDTDQSTLSKGQLKEHLNMNEEQDGAVVKGVAPAAHAKAIADNLRKARHESVIECRKFVTELQNFTADHPVDDPDYQGVCEKLEKLAERLEAKTSGAMKGSELDEEWRNTLELIADRIEKIYSRST